MENKKEKPAVLKFFTAACRWIKRHKVIFAIIIVVIVVAVIAISAVVKSNGNKPEFSLGGSAVVETRDLSNTVSVTGTLEANETRTVTASVSDIKIASIDVEVGDYVNEGDVLMTYDSDDIKEKVAETEAEIDLANYKSAHDVQDANESLLDAQWKYDRSVADANEEIGEARGYYELMTSGNEDYSSGEKYFEKKLSDFIDYNSKHNVGMEITLKTKQSGNTYYDYDYNECVKKFKEYLDDAEKDYLEKIDAAEDQLTKASVDNTVSSKQAAIDNTKNTRTLREAKEDLEETVVKAPISGYITSIPVEVGDTVFSSDNNQTTLCVVQDTSSFRITGTVDEYDIAKLEKDQSAVVKFDSTDDEKFEATVTFVAPTPDSTTSAGSSSSSSGGSSAGSSSSSSSSGSYEVELKLLSTDDRLRVGMTAKTSIILEKAEGVLCVPYSCINTEPDGKSYVTVVKDDVTNERVEVTVGFKSDYYEEISGEGIEEGTIVVGDAATGIDGEFAEDGSTTTVSFGGPGGGGPGGGPGGPRG